MRSRIVTFFSSSSSSEATAFHAHYHAKSVTAAAVATDIGRGRTARRRDSIVIIISYPIRKKTSRPYTSVHGSIVTVTYICGKKNFFFFKPTEHLT